MAKKTIDDDFVTYKVADLDKKIIDRLTHPTASQVQETQTVTQILIPSEDVKIIGRKLFVTNPGTVDNSFDPSRLSKSSPAVTDTIRAKCGKYWTNKGSSSGAMSWTESISDYKRYIPVEMLSATEVIQTLGATSNMFETVEVIGLKAHKRFYTAKRATRRRDDPRRTRRYDYDPQKFWSIFEGVFEGLDSKLLDPAVGFRGTSATYYDHTFRMDLPLSHTEVDLFGTGFAPAYAQVKGVYNFYIESYEKLLKTSISEKSLLSLYVVYMEAADRTDVLSLGGAISEADYQPLDSTYSVPRGSFSYADEPLIPAKPLQKYYDEFSSKFWGKSFTPKRATLASKSSNLLIGASGIDHLPEYNNKKYMFPMYFEIEFRTDSTTEFAQTLKKTQMAEQFQSAVIASPMKPMRTFESRQLKAQRETTSLWGISLGASFHPFIIEDSNNSRRTFDITAWLESLKPGASTMKESEGPFQPSPTLPSVVGDTAIGTALNTSVVTILPSVVSDSAIGSATVAPAAVRVLGTETVLPSVVSDTAIGTATVLPSVVSDTAISTQVFEAPGETSTTPSDLGFFKSFMSIITADKLQNIVENTFRSFGELMRGKPAYSETVFYRIEKIGGSVLQNFYLLNSNDVDVHTFIDTQVKYNKEYTYTIYAYQLVVGTAYRYESISPSRIDSAAVAMMVRQTPSLRLVEMPLYTKTSRIMDAPPVAPDTAVIPFKGVNNRVRFMMNNPVDTYKKVPILVSPEDARLYGELAQAQEVSVGEEIRFNTDDTAKLYEVYRLDFHPRFYEDFAGNQVARVSTDISLSTPLKASSLSYDDRIKPNKKYYYMFRSVDVHDHPSYPSIIHEVEMVDEGGMIFLIHNVVKPLGQQAPKQATKSIKRYLRIEPSTEQSQVDYEKMGVDPDGEITDADLGRVALGPSSGGLWDRKFKIRLTSRNTGRKIDFNVEFTHESKKMG